MDFKELKKLIEIVTSESDIDEVEIEQSGLRLRVRKAASIPPSSHSAEQARPAEPSPATASEEEESPEAKGFFYATSPMVGTFYRAPGPDAEPFVKVGDFVEKGSVICIIEAMKLMNEIESEVAGEVVSIAVDNGHPVEFGERLFAIRQR